MFYINKLNEKSIKQINDSIIKGKRFKLTKKTKNQNFCLFKKKKFHFKIKNKKISLKKDNINKSFDFLKNNKKNKYLSIIENHLKYGIFDNTINNISEINKFNSIDGLNNILKNEEDIDIIFNSIKIILKNMNLLNKTNNILLNSLTNHMIFKTKILEKSLNEDDKSEIFNFVLKMIKNSKYIL